MRADVTAVLLAGGGPDDPLARAFGVSAKALVPVDGSPMIVRIGAALAASPEVSRIVCVAAPEVAAVLAASLAAPSTPRSTPASSPAQREAADRVELVSVPAGLDFAASLALGIGAALAFAPERLLLLGADVPWLRAADVTHFVHSAAALRTPAGAVPALVYPVVPRAASEAAFPGQRRTWVRVAGGPDGASQQVTGGNLALVAASAAPRLLALAADAYRARKRPLALARLAGPATLLRLLAGRLRIDGVERRVGTLLGLPVRTLVTDLAALAADLDRPDQIPADGGLPPSAAPFRSKSKETP